MQYYKSIAIVTYR